MSRYSISESDSSDINFDDWAEDSFKVSEDFVYDGK